MDTATHSAEQVTLNVSGMRLPAKANRSARNPSEGERQLKRFMELLLGVHLVTTPQGELSADGTRFAFTLRQIPNNQRLAEIVRIYKEATGRDLQFVWESSGGTPPRATRPSVDLKAAAGGLLDGLLKTFGLD